MRRPGVEGRACASASSKRGCVVVPPDAASESTKIFVIASKFSDVEEIRRSKKARLSHPASRCREPTDAITGCARVIFFGSVVVGAPRLGAGEDRRERGERV